MTTRRVSLAELDIARAKFPQAYNNLVHVGPRRGLFCAKCGTEVQPGGGHGRDEYGITTFSFSYYYCQTCDEFVEWSDFRMTEHMRTSYKSLMRDKLRKLNNEQSYNC